MADALKVVSWFSVGIACHNSVRIIGLSSQVNDLVIQMELAYTAIKSILERKKWKENNTQHIVFM